ncbi:hypothetical protein D3C73_920750 [compost metagenome]
MGNGLIVSKLHIIGISIISACTIVGERIRHGIVVQTPATAVVNNRIRQHIVIPCYKGRRNCIITGNDRKSTCFQIHFIGFFTLCCSLFPCKEHDLRSCIFEINAVLLMEILKYILIIVSISMGIQYHNSVLLQSLEEVNICCGILYPVHEERRTCLHERVIHGVIYRR